MNVALVWFWILALIAVVSAILMVANRNPVRSALFLVANFFILAILYLTLSAQFIAAVQIIVYAGAIMVLFLFVIMLLNLGSPEGLRERGGIQAPVAVLLGLIFLSVLSMAGGISTGLAPGKATPSTIEGSPRFAPADIRDVPGLAARLQDPQDPVSQYLKDRLSDEAQRTLAGTVTAQPFDEKQDALLAIQLANELNRILEQPGLYDQQRFAQVYLSPTTRRLIAQNPQEGEDLLRLNRLLLEQTYPLEIAKSQSIGAVETVGLALFDSAQPWLFPFEVTSILLLVGIVGAIVMAKRQI